MSDVTSLLQSVPASKKAPAGCDNLLEELSTEGKMKGSILSVEDVVHLQENFSGTRLTQQLPKKLPDVMPREREEKKKGYYLSERSYGSFQRSFRLPDDVQAEKIKAEMQKGVMSISLPRSPSAKPKQRKIAISAKK